MPRLLLIHHSPTPAVRALTEQVAAGAADPALAGVELVVLEALAFARGDADHTAILGADGYLLGTSANFGYMSGALKHVFDATFLQIGGALDAGGSADGSIGAEGSGGTRGRPFGLYVHGRYDTTGATRSVLSMTGALGWRQGFEVLEVLGEVTRAHLDRAYELGGTIAALLTD